jgi:hypothetical protein
MLPDAPGLSDSLPAEIFAYRTMFPSLRDWLFYSLS